MTGSPIRPGPAAAPLAGDPPRRSWWAIRWRQFRNAPRPVVRAVLSSGIVATILGVAYLAYDVALTRGARLPGGDLRFAAAAVDVVLVLAFGSVITWLIVPLPRGAGTRAVRTWWSAALGLFAAIPIAYLALVVASQILKPLLV
ncbi:MAG TPA: hypothetical protein VGJ17_08015 [Candidatus Limnocylindrales bacterium]